MALPCLLVLLELCLVAFAGANSERVGPDSEAENEQVLNFHDPKYTIEMHPTPSPYVPKSGQEVVVMTNHEGRKFVCALPKPLVQHTTEAKQNGTSSGVPTDHKTTRKTADDLLDVLRDKLLLKSEGWWMYEFSYQKHFKQYHDDKDNKGKAIEFSLGKYDAEATAALQKNSSDVFTQPDPRSRIAAQRYHAHVFTNGTICDVTGQLRQSEVRFVCAEELSILSFKEAPTCKYTLVISVPTLCQHPLYQQERQPWFQIHCTESNSDSVSVKSAQMISSLIPVEVNSQ